MYKGNVIIKLLYVRSCICNTPYFNSIVVIYIRKYAQSPWHIRYSKSIPFIDDSYNIPKVLGLGIRLPHKLL